MAAKDDEELGRHCMEHMYPEFRSLVKSGQRVVVGGRAFGCGSSREQAVNALKGRFNILLFVCLIDLVWALTYFSCRSWSSSRDSTVFQFYI